MLKVVESVIGVFVTAILTTVSDSIPQIKAIKIHLKKNRAELEVEYNKIDSNTRVVKMFDTAFIFDAAIYEAATTEFYDVEIKAALIKALKVELDASLAEMTTRNRNE